MSDDPNKFQSIHLRQAERKVRREQERNGGLSVDDNKGLLFIGIILIIIGLAGLKF